MFREVNVYQVVHLVIILIVTQVYVCSVPRHVVLVMDIHLHNVFLVLIKICFLAVVVVRVNVHQELSIIKVIVLIVLSALLFQDVGSVPIQVFVMFVYLITPDNQIANIIVLYLQLS